MERQWLSSALRAFGSTALAGVVASGAGEWGGDDSAVDVEALRVIYRRRLMRNNLDISLRRALESILTALDRPEAVNVAMLHLTAPGHDVLVLVDNGRGEVIGILPAGGAQPGDTEE